LTAAPGDWSASVRVGGSPYETKKKAAFASGVEHANAPHQLQGRGAFA
jgi:hypothetical protein